MAKVKKLTREEGSEQSDYWLNKCRSNSKRDTETWEHYHKRFKDLQAVLCDINLKAVEAGDYDTMCTIYRLFFQAPIIQIWKRPGKWKTYNRRMLDKVNAITKQAIPALSSIEELTSEKHGGDKKELARLNRELKAAKEIIPALERYVEINRLVLEDKEYERDRATFLKEQKHWMEHTRLKEAVEKLRAIKVDDPYATISRLLSVIPRPPHKIPTRKALYQRLTRKT